MNFPIARSSHLSARRGFTLIELLTVIAIIGILAAIIIPVVGKVRTTAKRAQGLNNLRQIMTGSITFMNDNRGNWMYKSDRITKADTANSDNWYPRVITRYLGGKTGVNDIFNDPMLPYSAGTLQFAANSALFMGTYMDGSSVAAAFNLNRLKNPARQVMFAGNWQNKDTGSGGWGDIQNTGVSIWSWPNAWNTTYTPTEAQGSTLPPDGYGASAGQIDLTRDPGQAKLGFMDGHVAVVKKDQMFHSLFDPRFN